MCSSLLARCDCVLEVDSVLQYLNVNLGYWQTSQTLFYKENYCNSCCVKVNTLQIICVLIQIEMQASQRLHTKA